MKSKIVKNFVKIRKKKKQQKENHPMASVILVNRGSSCKQADGELNNPNKTFWGSPGIFQ
jgi:hypothetical protein